MSLPFDTPLAGGVSQNPTAAPEKTSYESSPDVQRWLKEYAIADAAKPPFTPTFLAHQRDRLWVLSSLQHFYENDLITDVLTAIKSGKEATVYLCTAHPTTGAEYLAVKVYRPRMFRSLRNDAMYREGRAMRDESGQVVRSRHRSGWMSGKTERGRAAQVTSWIAFEYETMQRLHASGAAIPRPIAQIGNAVLMELIGDAEDAAPLLKHVGLEGDEARAVFDTLLREIALWLRCDRIHGDLSEYNILYWDDRAVIIDFAQAVDASRSDDVYPLLERDIARVCRYFARYGITADPGVLAAELWSRYLFGEL